jgi:membrane-bound lytic murein transglycosylase MltF
MLPPAIHRPPAWLLILPLLLAAVPVFAQQPAPQQTARENLSIDPATVMQPWKGDLDGMIKRGYIRVLTVYSKTFFFVDKGVQRGATHDAFRLFEQDLNMKLEKAGKLKQKYLQVRVVFIPGTRGNLLQALAEGKGDIAAANLTITPERQKLVDFSLPVYPNVSELLVSGPASPAVSGVDDLSGKEAFVRKTSSYYESLVALNKRLAAQKKPGVVINLAPEALEDEDLIEMVNAGLIPFIVVDRHKMDLWKQVFPRIKVHEGIALRTGGNIAWAVRKGSPQLKGSIDDFIKRHGKGTTSGNVIFARYLKSAKYVKDAASEAERRKFLSLIGHFKKYGKQYDMDWLLMAAQGYQESQLNQKVRSPVGAIGVMQVMPATGQELKVGDIAQTEPNIHAGIKYMRFMVDQYYEKEPMTKLDKALFAFASYNAGPARIQRLRQEAARRGLNPNIWFNNVEYVAAEKIGRETVTYVSNIYKYYIAYQLIMESQLARKAAVEKMKGGKR